MRLVLLLIAAALAACSGEDGSVKTLKVGEATFRVPDDHVRSLSQEPHQFVRIKPPEQTFELIYDSRTSRRRDAQGWPIVFSLNDETAPNIERHQMDDGKLVCRRAVNPRGGCGLSITHAGAEWDVLFARSRFAEAPAIRQRALAALKAYQL